MKKKGDEEKDWVPFRLDFVMKDVKLDEKNQIITSELVPHPERYVELVKDGKVYLKDIFLNLLIPKDEMFAAYAKNTADLPIYHLTPSVESTVDYSQVRKGAIGSEFESGKYLPPQEKAKQHVKLEISDEPRLLAFLSVDICNSTLLKKENSDGFERAYKIFLRELGTMVGQFNGAILKTTGDGFIAYIDHPSSNRQADNIIDLGISLMVITQDTLNPLFKDNGLPELHIRIGADFGLAELRNVEVEATGAVFSEVSSDALNRAVKIEQLAGQNEFLIGFNLYQTAHVAYLKRASQVELDSNAFSDSGYKIYRIN